MVGALQMEFIIPDPAESRQEALKVSNEVMHEVLNNIILGD